jgi:hypothetical protein
MVRIGGLRKGCATFLKLEIRVWTTSWCCWGLRQPSNAPSRYLVWWKSSRVPRRGKKVSRCCLRSREEKESTWIITSKREQAAPSVSDILLISKVVCYLNQGWGRTEEFRTDHSSTSLNPLMIWQSPTQIRQYAMISLCSSMASSCWCTRSDHISLNSLPKTSGEDLLDIMDVSAFRHIVLWDIFHGESSHYRCLDHLHETSQNNAIVMQVYKWLRFEFCPRKRRKITEGNASQ